MREIRCDGCKLGDPLKGVYHVIPAVDGMEYVYPCPIACEAAARDERAPDAPRTGGDRAGD